MFGKLKISWIFVALSLISCVSKVKSRKEGLIPENKVCESIGNSIGFVIDCKKDIVAFSLPGLGEIKSQTIDVRAQNDKTYIKIASVKQAKGRSTRNPLAFAIVHSDNTKTEMVLDQSGTSVDEDSSEEEASDERETENKICAIKGNVHAFALDCSIDVESLSFERIKNKYIYSKFGNEIVEIKVINDREVAGWLALAKNITFKINHTDGSSTVVTINDSGIPFSKPGYLDKSNAGAVTVKSAPKVTDLGLIKDSFVLIGENYEKKAGNYVLRYPKTFVDNPSQASTVVVLGSRFKMMLEAQYQCVKLPCHLSIKKGHTNGLGGLSMDIWSSGAMANMMHKWTIIPDSTGKAEFYGVKVYD